MPLYDLADVISSPIFVGVVCVIALAVFVAAIRRVW